MVTGPDGAIYVCDWRTDSGGAGKLSGDGKMYLERMQQAAHRMRQLINDLLTYSRVTSKAQPFVPVDLAKTCEDVLGDLQIAIESSQAKVTSGELPIIDADPLQMRLLLQNLIGNALKFRRKDVPCEITISAVLHDVADAQKKFGIRTGRVCEINVADNGIGFEMKYLDRIFAIFQRLHGRNEYEGTGVGLATCRKLVERHGGVITAQSAPNQGTTFIVALPVKQINPKAA
jgi:signal transduction histidine kinase